MTYYPDLGETTMISSGSHVRAIGWLDDVHDFQTGKSSPEFVHKLSKITENYVASESALGWTFDSFFGYHTCELCGKFEHGGNCGVPAGQVLYVAPAMISHYVEEHEYLPPQQFIDAVLESPIPGQKDYEGVTEVFEELHHALKTGDTVESEEDDSWIRWSQRKTTL